MKHQLLLIAILSIGLFIACASKKNDSADTQPVQIEDVKWQLTALKNAKVDETVNGKMPYLELRSSEKRYGASGGCNGIGGTYEISENNTIKFSRGFSTKMACQVMDIEYGLHDLFAAAHTFGLDAGNLMIQDSEGSVIARFKKTD